MERTEELNEIQSLQFRDKEAAEERLLCLLKGFGMEEVVKLTLNPKPESLNSVNGLVTLCDGKILFFKTHTEERELLKDYYNQKLLENAGYPVVVPKRVQTTPGEQIAFYEVIHWPTLFDAVKEEEDVLLKDGMLSSRAQRIITPQEELDDLVFGIYTRTLNGLERQAAEEAPVHQLFYHRVCSQARIDLYYHNKVFDLGDSRVRFEDLLGYKWIINGVSYEQTLGELIEQARRLLNPLIPAATIIGHGDAHNGNVFYDESGKQLRYFDPAFAGRHSPFLDLAKPLFHNVFARWMYFPKQVEAEFNSEYRIENETITVRHSFEPSVLREHFLRSRVERVLRPICRLLEERKCLPGNWRLQLRSALFCCPFLSVNLAASANPQGTLAERYSPTIRLLALCMSIEGGACAKKAQTKVQNLFQEISV